MNKLASIQYMCISYLEKVANKNLNNLLNLYHRSNLSPVNKLEFDLAKAVTQDVGLNATKKDLTKVYKDSKFGKFMKNPNKLNKNVSEHLGKVFNNKPGNKSFSNLDNAILNKVLPYYKNMGAVKDLDQLV